MSPHRVGLLSGWSVLHTHLEGRSCLFTAPTPAVFTGLGVDRYGGSNRAPCTLQYGYSRLLREVQDLEREFPKAAEVTTFVNTVAPLLALAMGLRSQAISDPEFSRQAAALKTQIITAMDRPAQHPGSRRSQGIFRAHPNRLYHWADDRQVPAREEPGGTRSAAHRHRS